MRFTAEQQRAIDVRGRELLVSAAAGSGKTAVLVERIIKLITDSKKPVDIDRLLVVTFTEAAAAEMRERISERLHDLRSNAPDDENIRRQQLLLPRAQISTIHKFCAGVIRRCFHLTELDPGFKIADETEVRLLKNQILDELFEEQYEGDDMFFELVDLYGGGKTKDKGLHDLVLEISGFISGFPWPERWLTRACEMYDTDDINATPWAAALRFEIEHRLAGVAAAIEYGMRLASTGAEKYLDALRSDMDAVERLRAHTDDFARFREELFSIIPAKLTSITAKDEFDPEIKERAQNLRNNEIKPVLTKDLRKLFAKHDMERDIRDLRRTVKALTDLTSEFIDRYGEAKRQRNIADFNDLEQFALKILLMPESDETNPVFSDAARELQELYAEVMIDEYQDSNLVQELILSAVAGQSRFMVGDVKQSIYKFRGARPELFMEKYNTYDASLLNVCSANSDSNSYFGLPKKNQKSLLITLSKNFRSRECVIDAVNLFFNRLMTPDSEIDYDADAALYYGADYPGTEHKTADNTEIYVIDGETDEEVSRAELEAMTIAARINELISEPMYVYDRAEKAYRRAAYKDIVILLRSVRGAAETFLDVLKRSGIPAFADLAEGYFESLEVMTMLSFLQITDNPRQDIPLIAVLRCPVYGLTDDELLEIRERGLGRTFYERLLAYAENGTSPPFVYKLKRFLSDLEDFRREAVYLPISELIDYIYTATDYFNYAGAMTGGAVRQANLRLLREKAVQYEETSYRGLFHFIAYMRKVSQRADAYGSANRFSMGSAKALSENANLVRIMTVHKSKGLEFPIVFVSMLGRGFSRQDERGAVILHSGLGIGSVHIDLERRIKSNTLSRMAAIIQLRRESIAEELRVMYVAFTRAREKLILTGSVSNLAKAREKWERYETEGKLPAHMIFGAACALDWIMPIAEGAGAGVKVYYKNISDLFDGFAAEEERDDKRRADIRNLNAECGADVRERLEWVYPLKEIARLPAKISISEIKRLHNRGQDSAAAAYIPSATVYEPPGFLQDEMSGNPTAAANRGTVMHTVLEHMDMTRLNDTDGLRALVSRLVGLKILTAYEAGLVDYPALDEFCRSDICRRIISAPDVRRETPFVIGLTPYQIYKKPEFKGIDANILVHGIIDCYFEENERLVLVDYKTGRAASPDEYGVQMAVYKLALERATGKEVGECLLYLFSEGRCIPAKLAHIL